MKEKIKNLSNKKIVITSLCVFAIILLLGFTYAIWSRTFNQTGENISTYDCFDISFNENVEGISMSNGYPISDEEGLKTDAYEVTITNTCKTVASYNVVLNKLNTSTLDDSHVKVAVNGDIKLLSDMVSTTSNVEDTNAAKIINTGVLAKNISKTISIRNWMDEKTSEEDGANKTFSYKVTIEAVAGTNKLLAANILSENIKEEIPNFKLSSPRIETYKEKVIKDYTLTSNEKICYNKTTTLSYGGSSYTFDKESGMYTVTDNVNQIYDESMIGKYQCENSTSSCNRLFKIKEIDTTSSSTSNCITKVDVYEIEADQISIENGLYKTEDNEGETYYYRGNVKNNYVEFGKYSSDVNTYEITTKNNADDKYTFYDYNTISYYCNEEYNSGLGYDSAQECLNSIKVNKLYANNTPIKWRIVRVNGNGTIRLISEDILMNTKYGQSEEEKYVGYTYDNNHLCTSTDPCTKDAGINSIIKQKAEEWYTNNLQDYDNYIALERYCNDTHFHGTSTTNYGFMNRKFLGKPSLQCSDPSKNYGGVYKLKIGLLTADELMLAGFSSKETYKTNYLYKNNEYYSWTMTPHSIRNVVSLREGQMSNEIINNDVLNGLRPVINLKSDVRISGGNGTKENPYVIE